MKLYYFDLYARGEPIRLLLNHANIEFEDVRVTGPTWQEFKADKEKCPYGQVPVLEVDGKFLAQGTAILRFLGTKYGYYPKDAEHAYQVDQLLDLCSDFMMPMVKLNFSKGTEEEK